MSMKILGQLLWPGGSWPVPRGWAIPTCETLLTIGVPNNPPVDEFMGVTYKPDEKPFISGLSIDVFNAILEHLPNYDLPHVFIPYNGTYDSLVEEVNNKTFDAAVGDIAIVAKRNTLVDFSHPWTDSGVQIMVFRKSVETESLAILEALHYSDMGFDCRHNRLQWIHYMANGADAQFRIEWFCIQQDWGFDLVSLHNTLFIARR